MPSSSVKRYAAGLRARRAEQQSARARDVTAVRAKLGQLRSLLRERYGIRRVVLFGSFARGDARSDSDVDLWVEGLAPKDYFDAAATTSRLLRREVDLVRAEDSSPLLLERIALQGIEARD